MSKEALGYAGISVPTPANTRTPTIQEQIQHQYNQQAMRANLRERIVSRTYRAQSESIRLQQLNRLAEIIEKHPDFCEFIDLIQSLDLM